MDAIWRKDTGIELALRPHSRIRSWTGVLGYYSVQLPWMAYKGYKEWHGKTPDASGKRGATGGKRAARKRALKEVG